MEVNTIVSSLLLVQNATWRPGNGGSNSTRLVLSAENVAPVDGDYNPPPVGLSSSCCIAVVLSNLKVMLSPMLNPELPSSPFAVADTSLGQVGRTTIFSRPARDAVPVSSSHPPPATIS